jgi:hypothetical protein
MYFPEFSAFLFLKNHWEITVFKPDRAYSLHVYCRNGAGSECFKKKAHDAVVISHASIIIPFALGIGLSYFIYQEFAPNGFSLLHLLYL